MKVASRAVVLLRCAFCRGALDDTEETLTCPDCATLVHDACQLELPVCPTLGCESLKPWEVAARKPVAAARSSRWRRGVRAVVLAAGVACGLVGGPSPARIASVAAPEHVSAWALLGANSVLVTRTSREEPVPNRAFDCCADDGPGCSMCTGWGLWLTSEGTERRYRVRWVSGREVDVELQQRWFDPGARRPPGLQEELTARRSYFKASSFETTRQTDAAEACELVTVPAGTFPAAYRRVGELGTDRETALIETWTASWCPVPLKIVRSWVAPGKPAEIPTTETTVLVRFEPGAVRRSVVERERARKRAPTAR